MTGNSPPLVGAAATTRRRFGAGALAVAGSAAVAGLVGSGVTRSQDAASASVTPVAADPVQPYRGQYFGCHISGAGLGNTRYWTQHAHRFRCELSGPITGLRWYNVVNSPGQTGYSNGLGGRIQVQIRTDDGGMPGEEVLGETAVLDDPFRLGEYPLVTFETPVVLEEHRLYHIVYRQLAPDRGLISVNDIWAPAVPQPRSGWPFWNDDLASILHGINGHTGWAIRENHIPIFELHYRNGAIKGQGYTFGGFKDARTIDGPRLVRQRFGMDRGGRTVGQVRLRLWRGFEGDGDLSIRLTDMGGRTIGLAEVPRTAISASEGDRDDATTTIAWVSAVFDRPARLEGGTTYGLVLSAPGGAGYRIASTFKGFFEKFTEDKMWPEETSYAQFSDDGGASWRGWSLWGSHDRADTDLPVLFTIVG
ncbi:hypothetical protein [Marinivivus vitaminiproducens]|uniref:hypothetical protein n=1 Tax=Marinivivus vitaminiproducens TaxID=3035935 RepID=UPI0027AB0AAE|nr:hypothetical protein P4R82_20660 [Geminicoccaceae bacterium SCSIO 64248]